MTLPTNMGIDLDNFVITYNYNEMRDHTEIHNKQTSRTVSMFSSKSLIDYYIRIEQFNNSIKDEDLKDLIDRSQLLYVTSEEQRNQVSIVTDPMKNIKEQCIPIEGLSKSLTVDFIFICSFHFILFLFLFYFLFLEQLGLRLICHAVISVTT